MSFYDLSYTDTTGKEISLANYKDHLILIVNTATWCGLAPQLRELETLYEQYQWEKFVVLGFPCNQFAGQEQVEDSEMISTCNREYGVTFPLGAKILVNGKETHPLFKHLKDAVPNGIMGKRIKRNFTKFLVGRQGDVLKRYGPTRSPLYIQADIDALLSS